MRNTENDIQDVCKTFASVINALRLLYRDDTDMGKKLLRTMIGSVLWYQERLCIWTGYVSNSLLEQFHPYNKVECLKWSEEHEFPRTWAADELLKGTEHLDGDIIRKLFMEKYGRCHRITKMENQCLKKYQKISVFSSPEESYHKAGIILIKIIPEDWKLIKKRDRDTIEHYLECKGN